MKKTIIKKLEAEAVKLPIKLISQKHTEYFTGAEAIEAQKRYGGPRLKFDPNRSYPTKTPVMREINHLERMNIFLLIAEMGK